MIFNDILHYLAINLLEKKIAPKYYDLFFGSFEKLCSNPFVNPIVTNTIFSYDELRKYKVKNYLVFYRVNKKKKQIEILRIRYGKSNWKKII